MFTSGEGSSLQDQSGAAGEIFVPTRFVWPHGGRRVLLTGTFTRWSGLVPMSPVEGCPTIFQVVYPVSLGSHQYKFNVDDQWRHDDNQPHATGEYGIVNTVVLTQEHVSGTGTMDVDNEQLHPLVAESGGSMQEAAGAGSISEADLEQSRHSFSSFLSSHIAYELLPESGKVTALDVNLPVKQAFHILYEKGISMAPLWDFFRGQFVGVLSALDFILILRELGNNGSNLSEEELETHTISAWKEGKRQLYGHVDEQGRPVQRHLIHAGPYDSLRDVALRILQNEVATVPIIHSSTEDGLFPQLLHVSSLSEILRCVCRHFRHSSSSLPVLQRPICTLPLGTWVPKVGESHKKPLTMLQPHISLSSALILLIQARVSSLPIVDDNGSLLDIYSRSDITTLAKDRAYAHIRLDEMSIDQALQLGRDSISPHGYMNGDRFQMCLRTDPLLVVMERLANPGVRRIIIVEAGSRRVEGIISLSDVFRFFLG